MRGSWSFHDAEQRAKYLLAIGKAIAPEEWVTGLVVQGYRTATGAVLEGLI